MLEVGNGHDDGIDIFAIEEFSVIARCWNFGAVGLYAGFAMHVVEIGGADKLRVGQFARRAEEITAANAGADRDEADFSVA